jgi:hypothetical protein
MGPIGGADSPAAAAAAPQPTAGFGSSPAGIGTFAGIGAASLAAAAVIAYVIKARQIAAAKALASTVGSGPNALNKRNPLHIQRLPSPQLAATAAAAVPIATSPSLKGAVVAQALAPAAATLAVAPAFAAQYSHFKTKSPTLSHARAPISSVQTLGPSARLAAYNAFQAPRDKVAFAPKAAASSRALV